MTWLFAALAAPLLYAVANTLDTVITNRRVKNIPVLLFFVGCLNALYVPFTFLFQVPRLPTAAELPILIFLGFTNAAYLYPYYKALQHEDTSIVSALFSLSRITIPILAFFFVGEILGAGQYVGFALVILASVALSIDHKKLRLNKSFFYMAVASLIISVEIVAQKYAFARIEIPWGTLFAWQFFFSFLWLSLVLLSGRVRSGIRTEWGVFRQAAPLVLTGELFTFSATAAASFAISISPVSIVAALTETSPFFALLIGIFVPQRFKHLLREKTDKSALRNKLIWFAVMLFGILLLTGDV